MSRSGRSGPHSGGLGRSASTALGIRRLRSALLGPVLCLGVLVLLSGLVGGVSAASAAARHCKRGYVRKAMTRRVHGKKVKVETCVKRKQKPAKRTTTTTTTTSTTSTASPTLGVHIDTSLTRLPYEPLRALVKVSASASVSPLPEGSIDLYVDGLGECVLPVGGSTSGGECLVLFPGLGQNKLGALYVLNVLTPTTEVREAVTVDVEPLAVTTSTAIEDAPFSAPHEECEAKLVEAHECDRLLLGTITVRGGRSPANAEGSDSVVVGAPVCEWWEEYASCETRLEEGWSPLVLYEWAEGERRGLVVDPSLPQETKAEHEGRLGSAWSTLRDHALDSEATYQAHTRFTASELGYSASEPAAPLTLLP